MEDDRGAAGHFRLDGGHRRKSAAAQPDHAAEGTHVLKHSPKIEPGAAQSLPGEQRRPLQNH